MIDWTKFSSLDDIGNLQTFDDFYNLVTERGASYLEVVPEDFKTNELCKAAFLATLQNNSVAEVVENLHLLNIPISVYDQELADLMFLCSPELLGLIPQDYVTNEMVAELLENNENPKYFKYIPGEYWDIALINYIVGKYGALPAVREGTIKYILKNYPEEQIKYQEIPYNL